jgi:hypothetical protein
VLLTRSPLGLLQCCHWLDLVRLACIKHAASVRPEPGSNSPSKSRAPPLAAEPFDRDASWSREYLGHEALAPSDGASTTRILTVRFVHTTTPEKPSEWSPALALSSSLLFSRSGTRSADTRPSPGSWCPADRPAPAEGGRARRRTNLTTYQGGVNLGARFLEDFSTGLADQDRV